jgi:hypothetical protein
VAVGDIAEELTEFVRSGLRQIAVGWKPLQSARHGAAERDRLVRVLGVLVVE